MSAFSDYLEGHIANWLRGTDMPSAPAAVYVALFNGDPTDDGTGGSEVTTTVRVAGRVAVTFNAPTDGVIDNSGIVDFGSSAGATTVTHFALFDAAAAGNMVIHGALTSSKSISTSDPVQFALGTMQITIA